MIAKSISYQHLFKGITTISSADRKALFAGWAVAKYVLGLELDAEETALIREASNIGAYGPDGRGEDTRVLDAKVFNLDGDTQHDLALEFAYRVAASGKNSLRQVVVAYGEEPVMEEMAERHRETFRRVLRAEGKPMIYSKHGDTQYDHWHLAVCTADAGSGKVGEWGQGKEIEALHIALAICEAQDGLKPEPNRRYVADQTGVYHTWSGFRIAEANGDIISRGAFKAVEAEQVEFDAEVLTPTDGNVGQSLPTTKAIKLLARGVTRQAKSWDELHRGLARVGIRYEPYRVEGEIAGGHLVANGVRDIEDDRIAASAVNAGYKRLRKKLGDRPYEPPSRDIRVRPFVAPAYRKMAEEPAQDILHELDLQEQLDQQARTEREFEEFKLAMQKRVHAIKAERAEGIAAREKMASIEEKRRHHNQQQKREKASREEADRILSALQLAFERETGRKRKGPRPKTEPASSALWGEPEELNSGAEKDPRQWVKRYVIETLTHSRNYRLNGEIAFVETASFIAVHSQDRQAKIDALRRAQEKFGTVKIVGPPSIRREMLLLAAQEQIALDATQAKEAEKLLEKEKSKLKSDGEGGICSPTSQRQEPKKQKPLSPDEQRDQKAREMRSDGLAPKPAQAQPAPTADVKAVSDRPSVDLQEDALRKLQADIEQSILERRTLVYRDPSGFFRIDDRLNKDSGTSAILNTPQMQKQLSEQFRYQADSLKGIAEYVLHGQYYLSMDAVDPTFRGQDRTDAASLLHDWERNSTVAKGLKYLASLPFAQVPQRDIADMATKFSSVLSGSEEARKEVLECYRVYRAALGFETSSPSNSSEASKAMKQSHSGPEKQVQISKGKKPSISSEHAEGTPQVGRRPLDTGREI